MPGPETTFRPPETHTGPRPDEFNIPDVANPEDQQMAPFGDTEYSVKPLHENDLDVVVPDDTSMLDPVTGEFLEVPDDASSLDAYTKAGEYGDAPPTPLSTSEEKIAPPKLKVVIAGLDQNIDQFAREAALREMEEEKIRKGPLFKHLAKRVWHTLTFEYQVVKRTRQKREEIIEAQNLRHHQGGEDVTDAAWKEATIQRLGSEYGDKLVREEMGESYHKLDAENASDPETPEGKVRLGVLDFLKRISKGEFAEKADFEEAFEEWVNEQRKAGITEDLIGEGRLRASNMFAMGEQVKAAVEAREGLSAVDKELYRESILQNADIVLGEAKVGSTVDLKATTSERLAGKVESLLSEELLEKLRNKGFIPETVIAGATSLLTNEVFVAGALSVLLVAGKKSTSFIPGLGAAVVAGFRARREVINARALADRRADNGEAPEGGSKLQEAIDQTVYETRSATEMLDELGSMYNERGELRITNREDLQAALKIQAEIIARLDLHFDNNRLVSFENADVMEDQRFDLEAALAKLETDMGKLYEDEDTRASLGIAEEENFADMLEKKVSEATGSIEGGMKQLDKLLNKLVIKEVLKKGVITGLSAAAMGEALKLLGGVIHEAITAAAQGGGAAAPEMTLASMEMPYEPGGGGNTVGVHADVSGAHPESLDAHAGHPVTTDAGHPSNTDAGTGHPANLDSNGSTPNASSTNTADYNQFGPGQVHPENLDAHAGHPNNLDANGGADTGHPANLDAHPGHPANLDAHPGHPDNAGTTGHPESVDAHAGHPNNLDARGGETTTGAHTEKLTDTSKLNLPNGYHAEASGNHVNVTGPDGKSFGVDLNKDGTLSKDSLNALRDHGLNVNQSTDTVDGPPHVTHETVTSKEFVGNHPEMQKIKVVGWMDNDSRQYDLNELGDQHEVLANGDVKISAEGMTSGGSFHNGQHIDMHEAAQSGRLVVTVSADRDSQAHAFVLHMDKEGNVILGRDDPARALYDSHGHFKGAYEHIGVTDGKNPAGSTRIISLATVVGKNSGHFQDTISTPTHMEVTTYTVTPSTTPESLTSGVGHGKTPRLIPIPIPIITRTNKKSNANGSSTSSGTGSGSGGGSSTGGSTTTPPTTPPPGSGPTSRPRAGGSSRTRPGGTATPGGPSGRTRRPTTPGGPTTTPGGGGSTSRPRTGAGGPTTTPPNPNAGGGNPNTATPPPFTPFAAPGGGPQGQFTGQGGGQQQQTPPSGGTGQPNGQNGGGPQVPPQTPPNGGSQTPPPNTATPPPNNGGTQQPGGSGQQQTPPNGNPQTPPPNANAGGQQQTPPSTATPPPNGGTQVPPNGGTQTPPPNTATPPPPNGGTQTPPPNTATPPPPPPPTHGEAILNNIRAETRSMPAGVSIPDMDGLSYLEQKMIIRMSHEIINRVLRKNYGSDYDWQVALLNAFSTTADFVKANIKSAPPEVQSLLNTASAKLKRAQFDGSKTNANATP